MGVTNLKNIANRSGVDFHVFNWENAGDTRPYPGTLIPGNNTTPFVHDMWIPWCSQSADFPAHHITLTSLDGTSIFTIWQSNMSDGDHVRVSTDSQWHATGNYALPDDGVNGDRTAVLVPAGQGGVTSGAVSLIIEPYTQQP